MPGPQTTLLVEGTFKELVEEISDFIDNINSGSATSASTTPVATEASAKGALRRAVDPLLESYVAAEESGDADDIESARDDVLKPVVQASGALSSAPERAFIAAYNLLIHLVNLSPNVNQFLQPICRNVTTEMPAASSPANRFALVLSVLSTVFNVRPDDDAVRYPVFSAIIEIVSKSGGFENLRPQLKHLDAWLAQWGVNAAQQRRLFQRISALAREAGEEAAAYEYQIRALRTVPSKEAGSEEARKLSIEALKTALNSPTHYDFEDLASLDSIQALGNSDAVHFEMLEIFTSQMLDDFVDFKEEHDGWVEAEGLDDEVLTRKMRLLTLASLAAAAASGQQQSRMLPYAQIAKALQIPSEDVEMWVIDVIRAGLVEGKLSQLNKTFLIHRSTYRVFSESQWREVAGRLDMWRRSLTGVLAVIRQEKEAVALARDQETRAAEQKAAGADGSSYSNAHRNDNDRSGRGFGDGGGGGGASRGFNNNRRNNQQHHGHHHSHHQQHPVSAAAALRGEPIDVGMD